MAWEFPEYPENWEQLKRRVLRRDRWRCQKCGATDKPLHVHHKVSLSRGGTNDLDNLVTLCEDCHAEYHPHMAHLKKKTRKKTGEEVWAEVFGWIITLLLFGLLIKTCF